jgi:hypothetical protein
MRSSLRRFAASALGLALALVLGAAAGCGNAPSKDQCNRLLEHLIDLEAQKGGGKAVTDEMKADLAKQKKQIVDYVHDKYMEECRDKVVKAGVECALTAKDDAALAKCDEAK